MNMKPIVTLLVLLLTSMFVVSSCSNQKGNEGMNGKETFATPEEAATKAKNDLIRVLESSKDLDLGIDVARLRDAQPRRLVRYMEVDFEKILQNDSISNISQIVGGEKSRIAPFVNGGEVVAIAEVAKVPEGWKVAALGNKLVMSDLNAIRGAVNENVEATVYEVPNLNIMIYSVRENNTDRYHLNFERFTVRDSVALSNFYPLVSQSARQFNERFGDQLRQGKLVK